MSENRIQDAINSVEPEAGAKERMYQNILEKAQQASVPAETPGEKKKKPIPFVRYALPIAACFCLLIIGAARLLPWNTTDKPGENGVQIPNPFVEVSGADDFKSIGITLDAPAGAQNVQYTIIDNEIAEVRFTVDGKNYTTRASAQSGDFSGLYGSEEQLETIDAAHNALLSAVQIDGTQWYKIVWTNGKVNYCLYGTDGAEITQVKAVYKGIVQ